MGKIESWTETNLDTKGNIKEKMEDYLNLLMDFYSIHEKLICYSNLILDTEAKNEKAIKAIEKLNRIYNKTIRPSVNFGKWLYKLEELDRIIKESALLDEHEFYLKDIVEKSKYILDENEEMLIAKMSMTGSKAWATIRNKLISTHMVSIEKDGRMQEVPLSELRNMIYSKDSKLRKKAYECELKSYKNIEDTLGAALNSIKGEGITTCKIRGYESPLEETLGKFRMERKTLDVMLKAIKDNINIFQEYYTTKAKLLGHENGLPYYDLYAPIGDTNMEFTYEEAKEYIVRNFNNFSTKLSEFAKNSFEKNWIDAEPRYGKAGGAFCAILHPIKQSRILVNFNGGFSDILTLAHELGHGYHGHCLSNETILNSTFPFPIAETASIFCETIIEKAALKEATPKEALSILEYSIQSYSQVIVDIYSRFLFESKLFEMREEQVLTVNEIKEIMLESQEKAYGRAIDNNYLHPYMWANKSHYYLPDLNYYNFPYAFGKLFAKGLYVEYIKQGQSFVKEYDNLLKQTGNKSITDLCKIMNININSYDFWNNSFKIIKDDIEQFMRLSKDWC